MHAMVYCRLRPTRYLTMANSAVQAEDCAVFPPTIERSSMLAGIWWLLAGKFSDQTKDKLSWKSYAFSSACHRLLTDAYRRSRLHTTIKCWCMRGHRGGMTNVVHKKPENEYLKCSKYAYFFLFSPTLWLHIWSLIYCCIFSAIIDKS